MTTNLAIIGGIGTGTVIASTIIDCIKSGADYNLLGFFTDDDTLKSHSGFPRLGSVSKQDISEYIGACKFIYSLNSIKKTQQRRKLLDSLDIPADQFESIVHPSAVVSDSSSLGNGVVIMPLTVVSPNTVIGNHSHMFAQAFLGHDSRLADFVFVANNASIGSFVNVGYGAYVGTGSLLREHISVGELSIVGMGSTVLKDVPPLKTVVGSPARIL